MTKLLEDRKIQFFFIFLARSLDAVSLFFILPFLFKEFGNEYSAVVEFLSIVSVAIILIKLGYDSLIIHSIKVLNKKPLPVVTDVLVGKVFISFFALPLVLIYYFLFAESLSLLEFLFLLLILLLSEIINTSQVTLIFKNAIWVLIINFMRASFLLLGAIFAVYFGDINFFIYLHTASLLLSSVFYFILNDFGTIVLKNLDLNRAFSTFSNSLDFFLVRVFSILSDKFLLALSVIFLTEYNLILLDVYLRYLLLFSVPAVIFFNFIRSRAIVIPISKILISISFLGILSGVGFYIFLDLAGYLSFDVFSSTAYYGICISMSSMVFLSQIMIFISDSVALNHNQSTGSKLVNFLTFCIPVSILILFQVDSIFFCILILHIFYLLGILSFMLQNRFRSLPE